MAQNSFRVHFDKDKHELTPEAHSVLAKVQDVLGLYPEAIVELIGHTDDDGEDAYNKRLSEDRIDAVCARIRSMPGLRVIKKAMGESDPIKPNTSDENKQINRCVEIRLQNCEHLNTSMGTRQIIDRMFGPRVSTFDIKANEKVTLTTRNGSYIYIEPFSFCDSLGKIVSGKVTINIREFRTYPEMLFSGITMNSNNNVLVSDGFYDLQAFQKNEAIQLRKGKKIEIIVNAPQADASMQYFRGNFTEAGVVNWTPENTNLFVGLSDTVLVVLSDTIGYRQNLNSMPVSSISEKPVETYNSIKARSISFDPNLLYLENPDRQQADSIRVICEMLRRQENEDLTAQVISRVFRNQNEEKINKLVRLLKFENIRFGTYDPARDIAPNAPLYLYKSSTQRRVDFEDVVFSGVNFNSSNVISFEFPTWRSGNYVINDEDVCQIIRSSQYIISTARLGLINCDKFKNGKRSAPLVINVNDKPEATTYVIAFKNLRSAIAGFIYSDGTLKFPALPVGEEASLLAYAFVDGEFAFSKSDFTVGDKKLPTIAMKSATVEDFKKEIESF